MTYHSDEKEFQAAIVKLAKELGWRISHLPRVSAEVEIRKLYDNTGFPDLVLAKDGKVLFLELKRLQGRALHSLVSEDQWDWMQDLPPGLAWIVGPADLQLVAELLSNPPEICVGLTPHHGYDDAPYRSNGHSAQRKGYSP